MSTDILTVWPLDLTFNLGHEVTDHEFLNYCKLNPDVRLELSAIGDLIIMAPTFTDGSEQSGEVFFQVKTWAKQDGRGTAYDSSGGFRLPNRAIRSPDTSWVLLSRLEALRPEDRKPFAKLSPDLAIEVRSPSDTIRSLEAKMSEYLENGTLLGVLIIPDTQTVAVYRAGKPVERFERPDIVDLSPEMPGLQLVMKDIFFPPGASVRSTGT